MLCSITEASELLGYKSRAQLYRMKEDHWLDDYIQMIDGKTYLHMEGPRGKPSLARHIMGIIDWRSSNTIIDFYPNKYIQDEAKRLNSDRKLTLKTSFTETLRLCNVIFVIANFLLP